MMSASRASLVAFGLILLAAQVKGTRRVTVDAAFRMSSRYLILLAGDESLLIEDGKEIDLGDKTDMEVPEAMQVQAAFSTGSNMNLLYYGPDSGYKVDLRKSKTKNLPYGSHRKFLQNGGPDAAARMNGKVYFFKGCEVVRRLAWNKWGESQNVTDIGLPCYPDAAWNVGDGKTMVVLKGDQIWLWHGDDVVDEPKKFSSMYTINSWELIPSSEK